jgi:pSer/pThr/pTyr-binding forkhead associated (FHA) protein
MVRSTDIEQTRIEDILSRYRDLQSQFDRARERLRRADEHKSSVNRRIFDRVRAEYDRELDSIRARMSPIREEIEQIHTSLEAQLQDANAQLASVEEELAEAGFRHLVGEYPGGDFESVRGSLDLRSSEARVRCDVLTAALDTLVALKTPEAKMPTVEIDVFADEPVVEPARSTETVSAPEPAPEPAPVTASATAPAPEPATASAPEPAPETAPRRPVLRPAGLASQFENPQEWLAEMGRDSTRPDRRVPASSEPAPAQAQPVAATPAAPPRATMPSLVFVSGAHAGQSIALLPTTLTIGREHDNNVEIKDPDVARYHARIMNERGNYVVEDLDSSTGTWVNGQRTRRATLAQGDVIRVGQTELAFDCEWTAASRR